jgi:hypothetical protein
MEVFDPLAALWQLQVAEPDAHGRRDLRCRIVVDPRNVRSQPQQSKSEYNNGRNSSIQV